MKYTHALLQYYRGYLEDHSILIAKYQTNDEVLKSNDLIVLEKKKKYLPVHIPLAPLIVNILSPKNFWDNKEQMLRFQTEVSTVKPL